MSSDSRGWLVPFGAAVWLHLTLLVGLNSVLAVPGEDFASYQNAARAALAGLDPYDVADLSRWGNPFAEGYPVHPYIYPPAALVLFLPLGLLDSWAWPTFLGITELAAIGSLFLWTRSAAAIDHRLAWLVALGFSLFPATLVNPIAGQVNWLVVFTTYLGLFLAQRSRIPGGIAVGVATALKVTPAILVLLWLLRRRWREAGAAVLLVVALTVAALPWLGPLDQLRFVTEILPSIGRGDIEGLVLERDDVGNNGPAPLLFRFLGEGPVDPTLPWRLGLPLLALAACWRAPSTAWQRWSQPVLLLTAVALTPAFLYEHHLIWAIPAWALVTHAAWTGTRAAWPGAVLGGLALLVPLAPFHHLVADDPNWTTRALLLQALDATGLVTLVATLGWLTARPAR